MTPLRPPSREGVLLDCWSRAPRTAGARRLCTYMVGLTLCACTLPVDRTPEGAVLDSLVPGVVLGAALPPLTQQYGVVSFVPEFGYSLKVANSALLASSALFLAEVGQTEPADSPSIRAVIITARGSLGKALASRAAQLGVNAYGRTPSDGCVEGPTQVWRAVLFWRARFGGTFIVFPGAAVGAFSERDPTAVHVVARWSPATGAIPRVREALCAVTGASR